MSCRILQGNLCASHVHLGTPTYKVHNKLNIVNINFIFQGVQCTYSLNIVPHVYIV